MLSFVKIVCVIVGLLWSWSLIIFLLVKLWFCIKDKINVLFIKVLFVLIICCNLWFFFERGLVSFLVVWNVSGLEIWIIVMFVLFGVVVSVKMVFI